LLLLALLLQSTATWAATPYVLKFATLAPQGSTWMNDLTRWAAQVKQQSHGRLVFRFYPGGIAGGERDVIREIHFGELQGAALTGHGVGEIYPSARIMEVPFLFHSNKERDYVRSQLMPTFVAGFRQAHFQLLGWMEVGSIHFFSTQPIPSLDALKTRKIWLWQGDAFIATFLSANGLSGVPLSIADVYTSLSTGLINTVVATPLSSIALQWFTKTPYMAKLSMANGIGVLVVSNRFFDTLPPALQSLLQRTGKAAGERLLVDSRQDDAEARVALQKNGVHFMLGKKDVHMADVIRMSTDGLTRLVQKGYISADVYQRTMAALRYERAHPSP